MMRRMVLKSNPDIYIKTSGKISLVYQDFHTGEICTFRAIYYWFWNKYRITGTKNLPALGCMSFDEKKELLFTIALFSVVANPGPPTRCLSSLEPKFALVFCKLSSLSCISKFGSLFTLLSCSFELLLSFGCSLCCLVFCEWWTACLSFSFCTDLFLTSSFFLKNETRRKRKKS